MSSFQPSASTWRSSKSAISLLSGSFNALAVMLARYFNVVWQITCYLGFLWWTSLDSLRCWTT